MVKLMNNFSKDNTYKLYRDVKEILHPVISKRNISDYEIIFNEDYLPVRIFYPQKVSFLDKVLIYLPGISEITDCYEKNIDICKEMALATNYLVIAINYFNYKENFSLLLQQVNLFLNYLLPNLEKAGILTKNISFIGDSFGATILSALIFKNKRRKTFSSKHVIFLYPLFNNTYIQNTTLNKDSLLLTKYRPFYQNILNTAQPKELFPLQNTSFKRHPASLIITGNLDPFKDDGLNYYKRLQQDQITSSYYNLNFEGHGFLKDTDQDMKKELYDTINQFLNS